MSRAIAIISGGMDSVTMLHWAVRGNDFEVIKALSFNYGSKHNKVELIQAQRQCHFLNVEHDIVDLSSFMSKFTSSSLINPALDNPEGHYSEDKMRVTVVPGRNLIMLAIAVGFAEDSNASSVLIGSHIGDRAQYPDCRVEFTQALSKASELGTYNKVKVVSPFNDLLKREVLDIGLKLQVPYEHTHSCYNGDANKCLCRCSTCMERVEAFLHVGVKDPIYTDSEWEVVSTKCKSITEGWLTDRR